MPASQHIFTFILSLGSLPDHSFVCLGHSIRFYFIFSFLAISSSGGFTPSSTPIPVFWSGLLVVISPGSAFLFLVGRSSLVSWGAVVGVEVSMDKPYPWEGYD